MNVLISGAGIAGLTLALCLSRRGHAVEIVERAPRLRDEGYMIDFFGSGYDAAERLGLLPELSALHYPIARLAFVDGRGRERFSLSYPAMRRLFHDRHFNFMRGELERLLHDQIAGAVPLRFGTQVESIEQDARLVRARLSDGTQVACDLLVGADGLHSRVRALLFGEEERFARFLGYRTAAFLIDEAPDAGLAPDAFYTLTRPGLQVGLYPIRGGRLATFFIHRADTPVEDTTAGAACRELREIYGSAGWIVPALLDACARAPEVYFDSVSQIEVPGWHLQRVVLLGDACQCVSLLAGQGASMAMAAAYILAEEIDAAAGDVPAALVRYERRLKPAIEKKQRAGRGMARWFVPPDRLRLAVRDLALRLSASPLGAWLVRRQLAGDSVLQR
jgi:2-polyprenyl-6-methoxyphenol hydroxylase-like FAD-dependent oxidoreductase